MAWLRNLHMRLTRRPLECALAITTLISLSAPTGVQAQTLGRLCDSELSAPSDPENCRNQLLTLIQNEADRQSAGLTAGLDVAFWYMSDARYSNLIVEKFQAGLPVRVLMDDRADESKPSTTPIVQQLKDAASRCGRRAAAASCTGR